MGTCAITTSFLGSLVTTYLYFRYTWILNLSLPLKLMTFAVFLLIGCIPLFVSYNMEAILGKAYPLYRYSLYFLFIGAVILFTITLLGDALFLLISYTPLLGKIKCICCHLNQIYLVLALLCTGWALYAGTKVPGIRQVKLTSAKITEPVKIALLSDIHIHRAICPKKVQAIVDKTNALEPDIILLDGDIIDDNTARVAEITALLKGLKAKQGIYFVTGNHEFYAGYQPTVKALSDLGFKFLENNGVSLGNIYLAGIPDTFSGRAYGKKAALKQAFAAAKDSQYRILMSHTPTDFGADNNFDLEVSGHTHGGQIFPFHILTKLHNPYLSGRYTLPGGAEIYVTNGAGQWGPQMRFLAPSEITVLNLQPKGK